VILEKLRVVIMLHDTLTTVDSLREFTFIAFSCTRAEPSPVHPVEPSSCFTIIPRILTMYWESHGMTAADVRANGAMMGYIVPHQSPRVIFQGHGSQL